MVLAACLLGAAGPPETSPPADLAPAWERAGRPVVLIVPDHLGLDARTAYYRRALLGAGFGVSLLDLPAWSSDEWSRLLPAAPHRPGAAEAILPLLLGALERLDAPGRRVGVLGLGPGAEAALLAAHEAVIGRRGPRFAAHAALYPSCEGPLLPALRAQGAATTGAPVLAVIPHAGGAGDMPDGCGVLFDTWEPQHPERVLLLPFDSQGYAFDLWPATAAETGTPIDPLRFDVLRTELARDAILDLFRRTLLPAVAVAGGHR